MKPTLLRAHILTLNLALTLTACQPAGHQFSGLIPDAATGSYDFTLVDEGGNDFALSELRGQWVLLFFGYTHCPDVCPATLQTLKQVKRALGADAEQVRVVFVSVDPARDDVGVLRKYVQAFGPDFKGLTGTPEAVASVAEQFGVTYARKDVASASGYLVSHTAYLYLLDPQANLRLTFPFGVKPEEVTSDLQYLMKEATE
jgi:protein SCO1/2